MGFGGGLYCLQFLKAYLAFISMVGRSLRLYQLAKLWTFVIAKLIVLILTLVMHGVDNPTNQLKS